LYVRANNDCLFWRVMMPTPNPPSYLPFVKNEALHQQYDYIRKYYSERESDWFSSRVYQYLNEKTMTRMVAESIEAVLLVYEKLQHVKNLDGLKTSVSLLPESLTMPYEEPLGNK